MLLPRSQFTCDVVAFKFDGSGAVVSRGAASASDDCDDARRVASEETGSARSVTQSESAECWRCALVRECYARAYLEEQSPCSSPSRRYWHQQIVICTGPRSVTYCSPKPQNPTINVLKSKWEMPIRSPKLIRSRAKAVKLKREA